MAKLDKQTFGSRVQIIEAITAPLGFYVLGLLIVEGFFTVITIASGFQREDRLFVIKLGAALFIAVFLVVSLLVWYKPANLMFDKGSILIDRGKVRNEEDPRLTAAATSEILRKFWKPDGKPNKQNVTRLAKWRKDNHIFSISLTAFITTESFVEFRRKAIRDLDIGSGERS